MAVWTVKTRNELENFNVLAPERYDPRRATLSTDTNGADTVPLASIVKVIGKTAGATYKELASCIVIDTSDAREGILNVNKAPISFIDLGSNKKLIQPGDVIISRLRPYLRQVAFIDLEIPQKIDDIALACSTEFYVLRSTNTQSIAFLAPFLLSQPVQELLSVSQEGGHHPRFNESTLLKLPISKKLLDRREQISEAVEASIKLFRKSEKIINEAIRSIESASPVASMTHNL